MPTSNIIQVLLDTRIAEACVAIFALGFIAFAGAKELQAAVKAT